MKKVLLSLVFVGLAFSTLAKEEIVFNGKTNAGEACSVKLIPTMKEGVYAKAKLSGNGVPFNLGNLRTKLGKFKMVFSNPEQTELVSMPSKYDPMLVVSLVERVNYLEIESYKLFIGGDSDEVVECI